MRKNKTDRFEVIVCGVGDNDRDILHITVL